MKKRRLRIMLVLVVIAALAAAVGVGCNAETCAGGTLGFVLFFVILVAVLSFFLGPLGVILAVAVFIGFMSDEGWKQCSSEKACGCSSAHALVITGIVLQDVR